LGLRFQPITTQQRARHTPIQIHSYSYLDQQKRTHTDLLSTVETVIGDIESGSRINIIEVIVILTDHSKRHILREDSKYGRTVKAKALLFKASKSRLGTVINKASTQITYANNSDDKTPFWELCRQTLQDTKLLCFTMRDGAQALGKAEQTTASH